MRGFDPADIGSEGEARLFQSLVDPLQIGGADDSETRELFLAISDEIIDRFDVIGFQLVGELAGFMSRPTKFTLL